MIKLPKDLIAETMPAVDSSLRFSSKYNRKSEQNIRFIDSSTGIIWGFLIIDDTRRGPAVGGIRIAENLSLEEMKRLAHAMTLKNSAACLPFGGGKAGLIVNPAILINEPNLKADLLAIFAEAIYPFDNYISAPDMGTNEYDIQQVYEYNSKKLGTVLHTRGGVGRSQSHGGIPIDDWELTAHGLVSAVKTLELQYPQSKNLSSAKIIIQGYGNVGSPTASKLREKGAIIVGASDINTGLWDPEGLNIELLNKIRKIPGGLRNYTDNTRKRFDSNQVDWLLEAPCDILVPAARPDAITARNAHRIQCKVILQGANAPVNKMTEYYLKNRRGIISLSDFIVNSGGIIGCAVELTMKADEAYKEKIEAKGIRVYAEELIDNTISKNVSQVLSKINAEGSDITFQEEGLILAKKRLEKPREIWI